jgi:D-alanyl-D-alanine carboxypeptidase (penicillin-binding protein 5/6)
VPELGVETASPNQPVEPIASLTKMMTAWVVLHHLPLTGSETGPCEVMNTSDVDLYNEDVELDLSGVKIVAGERLCERTLLRGMLVHSAGDYAQLLAALTGMRTATFVVAMNQDARALKLDSTHYTDVTGLSQGDRSTAENQATMAAALMNDEPVVQSIVDLSEVSLPVAGIVSSYTPYVGQANVVGVKSGFTNAAGGCDVMAMDDRIGTAVITTYAVVLGEHSDNPLGTAGLDALTLSHSIRTLMARVGTISGPQLRWIGPTTDVVTTTTSTTSPTTTSPTTTSPTTTTTTTFPTTTTTTSTTTTTTTLP